MTAVKIAGKPRAAAQPCLENTADWLWTHPGGRVIGVVEFVHTERSEPAPEEEKDRTVTLSMAALELATPEQEEALRKALRAMFLVRTMTGTLDPDGDVELSERAMAATGGDLLLREAGRLRAAVRAYAERARQAFQTNRPEVHELRHELDAIASGLERVLLGVKDDQ